MAGIEHVGLGADYDGVEVYELSTADVNTLLNYFKSSGY